MAGAERLGGILQAERGRFERQGASGAGAERSGGGNRAIPASCSVCARTQARTHAHSCHSTQASTHRHTTALTHTRPPKRSHAAQTRIHHARVSPWLQMRREADEVRELLALAALEQPADETLVKACAETSAQKRRPARKLPRSPCRSASRGRRRCWMRRLHCGASCSSAATAATTAAAPSRSCAMGYMVYGVGRASVCCML